MHRQDGMVTARIRIYGIVQGVGFRPHVSRLAEQQGIKGTVANKGSFVEVCVSGRRNEITNFYEELCNHPPIRAMIVETEIEYLKEFRPFLSFEIIESEKQSGAIFVSPDIALCEECRRELYDSRNRRYMHPFINCTNCGPRMTILTSVPYDRVRTSMSDFPMCVDCEKEYFTLKDRRYDAQPVCCNECGPEVYLLNRKERGEQAIRLAQTVLNEGGIIAVKGIGGFHLCCDALNENAVNNLRKLKRRAAKPFAVMMRNLGAVQKYCDVSSEERKILEGFQKPILLLEKRKNQNLAGNVADNNPRLGVMLPYTPLHCLLFEYKDELLDTDCLVMTSGNYGGMPICINDEEAEKYLLPYCDIILSHNRDILIQADDSVMDYEGQRPRMLRRSRGYAPLPVCFQGTEQVLAVGGELKNQICVGRNGMYYLSPYVGNISGIEALEALERTRNYMMRAFEIEAPVIACDMHPRYLTSSYAKELSETVIEVQHHHAHTVSCMAENGEYGTVIGVVYDGTGYGTDGTIWGGEILLADTLEFQRVGSIEPYFQVGGDASAKEGWRIAAGLLSEIYGKQAAEVMEQINLCSAEQARVLSILTQKRVNGTLSTSVGRVFDAVSAILGFCRESSYEGEAACQLEYAAERYEKAEDVGSIVNSNEIDLISKNETERMMIPLKDMIVRIVEAYRNGESREKLAYWFHSMLAEYTVHACVKIRSRTGVSTCTLSGGVFQNRLMYRLCKEGLEKQQIRVLSHHMVPANDGGLALGQAVIASEQAKRKGK